MGIETMGMDLAEQEKMKVTLPGQPGYRGAWDADRAVEASETQVRDSAIEGADIMELEEAVGRMEKTLETKPGDTDTVLALKRVQERLQRLVEKNQH